MSKEKTFETIDKIKDLEIKRDLLGGLNDVEDLELRNLRVKLSQFYSEWKD